MMLEFLKVIAESPTYKTVFRQIVEERLDPKVVEKETAELLSKDIEFTATLIAAFPRLLNASFALLRGINSYMSRFTEDSISGILKSAASEFDVKYASETVKLLAETLKIDPSKIAEAIGIDHKKLIGFLIKALAKVLSGSASDQVVGEFFEKVDIQKLREFIIGFLNASANLVERANEEVWKDPVLAVTLISAVPEIVNILLRVLRSILQKFDELPDDLLVQTAESLVELINVKEAGEVLTVAARLVNKISGALNRLAEEVISSAERSEVEKAMKNVSNVFSQIKS